MRRTFALGLLALLAGCMVGPDYKRPPAPVPADYKEDGWKTAEPKDAVRRDDWWSIYNDPVLDGLERQIDISNQTLKSAEAAYEVARAVVAEAQSGLFPTLTLTGSGTRSGQGRNNSFGGGTFGGGVASNSAIDLSAGVTWDLDVWGRIRRTVESDVASAQASAADIANARLSAQGQLAILYFELRAADALQQLLYSAVDAFSQSLKITKNQFAAGTVAETDVVTAETQVEQTRAQAIAEGVQRAQFEHAIAALIGRPPAELSIKPAPLATFRAGGSRRGAVGTARAPSRHRRGRAADGLGQCADRRRRRGVLSGTSRCRPLTAMPAPASPSCCAPPTACGRSGRASPSPSSMPG